MYTIKKIINFLFLIIINCNLFFYYCFNKYKLWSEKYIIKNFNIICVKGNNLNCILCFLINFKYNSAHWVTWCHIH